MKTPIELRDELLLAVQRDETATDEHEPGHHVRAFIRAVRLDAAKYGMTLAADMVKSKGWRNHKTAYEILATRDNLTVS